jgi:hypothetical protein
MVASKARGKTSAARLAVRHERIAAKHAAVVRRVLGHWPKAGRPVHRAIADVEAPLARMARGGNHQDGTTVIRQSIRRTGCDAFGPERRTVDAPRILRPLDLSASVAFDAGVRSGAFPACRATVARVPVTVGITTGM